MRDKQRIAFLGIGLMGKPMAKRLLNAGYELTVWNRTASKAEELIKYGAMSAATPADAMQYGGKPVDVVITMLEDGMVVRQLVQQFLSVMPANSIHVDMSSTKQTEAIALHELLAAQQLAFVDAPVSGGVVGAEAGSLAIMVGAKTNHYLTLEALFKVLGRPTHVGAPGSGQLAKLCNQLIVGGTLNLVAEALLLAQAGGANPVAVRNALRGGFAESRILEVHGQRMLDRNFLPGGQIKSQIKDMHNVLEAAHEAALQLPMAELITLAYQSMELDYPHADQSAALLGLEKINSGHRLGTLPDRLPD